MSAHEATEGWAAWDCDNPGRCPSQHCARCGQHCGGQGDTVAGFYFRGKWHEFKKSPSGGLRIVFSCSEEEMTQAMRDSYGEWPWIGDAIEHEKFRFRPDRRRVAL
jgi:hypothetical protein